MRKMSILVRLVVSTVAGFGAGVVAALVVTVIDLYLTGHGYGSITCEVITWSQAGVHLSIGDLVMLMTVIVAAVSTWYRAGDRA
ncbi:MAG: hypothetical protein ABIH03_04215 [Pseudomonadota bacterium]